MNLLETLYFPDTALFTDRQTPLFLLFPTVNHVALVEGDDDTLEPNSSVYGRFCHHFTPHPLGRDKDRFLYLINDIKNRKDDYAAQLSHLTLASMSHNQPKGEDAKHQIMSTILGPATPSSEQEEKTNDLLWHARLVLMIAQILDQEEEEVTRALIQLEETETDLFDQLKGSGDDGEEADLYRDLRKRKTRLNKPRTEAIVNRLRAWFRFTQEEKLPRCQIWSTTRQEVCDILIESHTKATGREPECIAELPLPLHLGGSSDQALEHLLDFQQESSPLLQTLYQTILNEPSSFKSEGGHAEIVTSWKDLVVKYYPEKSFGRLQAQFFHFQGGLSHSSGAGNLSLDKEVKLLVLIPV